jgi:LPS export ABC transporter protein LptC
LRADNPLSRGAKKAKKDIFVKYIVMVLALALAVLVLFGCDGQKSAVKTGPSLSDSSTRPDSEVKGAKIYLYDRGRITTAIDANKIVKFDTKDSTIGYIVHVNFYDSSGRVSSVLVGDSSISHENSGFMSVYGNVVAVSTEDSSKLETDYLRWNPTVNKIQTDAFVKITRHGDVVTGWGMESDPNLKHIDILKQVSGTFRDTSTAGKR